MFNFLMFRSSLPQMTPPAPTLILPMEFDHAASEPSEAPFSSAPFALDVS